MVVAFGDVTWSKMTGAWDDYRGAAQLKLRANKGSVPGAKLCVNYNALFWELHSLCPSLTHAASQTGNELVLSGWESWSWMRALHRSHLFRQHFFYRVSRRIGGWPGEIDREIIIGRGVGVGVGAVGGGDDSGRKDC